MAKNDTIPLSVESIRHKDKRANIPTEELCDFVADEELAPKTMLYTKRWTRRCYRRMGHMRSTQTAEPKRSKSRMCSALQHDKPTIRKT